jgi:hypothetical protein
MTPDGLHAGPMVRPFLRWIYDASQDDYIGRCQTAAALHCTARHCRDAHATTSVGFAVINGRPMVIIMAEAGGRLGCKMPGFGAGAAGS